MTNNNKNTSLLLSEFQDICRTCSTKDDLQPLYDNSNVEIVNMLAFSTQMQFDKYDGLPAHICKRCIKKLKDVYLFINTCKELDFTFKKFRADYYNNKTSETVQNETDTNPLHTTLVIKTEIVDNDQEVQDSTSDLEKNNTEARNTSNGWFQSSDNFDIMQNVATVYETNDEPPIQDLNLNEMVETPTTTTTIKQQQQNGSRSGSRKRRRCTYFRRNVFLLNDKNIETFPSHKIQKYLQEKGLGKAEECAVIERSWHIKQVENYVPSLFNAPISALIKKIGFKLGKCSKNRRKITTLRASSATELEAEIGNGVIIIIPNEVLIGKCKQIAQKIDEKTSSSDFTEEEEEEEEDVTKEENDQNHFNLQKFKKVVRFSKSNTSQYFDDSLRKFVCKLCHETYNSKRKYEQHLCVVKNLKLSNEN